ncbi:MAG TPA: penicillin-binding transpeptidase domain-containing protein, partial [Methylococcales bacterium]
ILNEKGKYMPATDKDTANPDIQKFIYKNKFGPNVFKNKVVSEYYEPGSTFKPIVMSIALDAKEVDPQTTFINDGPLHIDDFEIKNATGIYKGRTSMSDVIAYSLNTGMAFVAKLLGKNLMYQYLKDFGIGEYTNIKLEGEAKGNLDYYTKWSKAQLLTSSFGQGIVVTPLQLATAWCALANGGKLMEPYIVDSVIKDGKVIQTEPQIIKRVISEEASSVITSMLIYSVRYGFAKAGAVDGYLIAGKTGTAQMAGPNGKYETGDGATITTYAGYAPALEPKFVVLVKMDRPRIGESTWGETTAAPIFKDVTKFLLDYYNIQPNS